MEGLLRDIRYSVRSRRKRPAFSLLVILVLAVAIAANSSIFSIVNAVILKPLSFREPNQLVWIWATRKTVSRAFFSIPNFIDTREQNQTLAEVAPFAIWPANLTGQGEAERLQGVRIAANAMQMLGVEAATGRALVPDDDNPNNTRDCGHTFDAESFVCRGAHRSNDLWHFSFCFDRGRIVGLLYPRTTRDKKLIR